MRSVIDYAAPVFFNGLPQYLKKELVRLEKRAISIITLGKCYSAIEVGLTPILKHHYVLCSRLFDNIVSDPNHKLKALLPSDYDNSRYNLRRQCLFNMPKLFTNWTSNTFFNLYMRCRNSQGCSFIPVISMLYILTSFNMNTLYTILNIILKISFRLIIWDSFVIFKYCKFFVNANKTRNYHPSSTRHVNCIINSTNNVKVTACNIFSQHLSLRFQSLSV